MPNLLFVAATMFLAYSIHRKSMTPLEIKTFGAFPLKQFNFTTHRALLLASSFLFVVMIKDAFDTTQTYFMNSFYTFAVVPQILVAVIFWTMFLLNKRNFLRKESALDKRTMVFCFVRHGYDAVLLVLYQKMFNTLEIVYSTAILCVQLVVIFLTCVEISYFKERRCIYIYPFVERMSRTNIIQFMIINALINTAVYFLLLII